MQGIGPGNKKFVSTSQNFGASNKKIAVTKQQKIKTQMNLTGPLPKGILSPKTATNKSGSRAKHSQYFGGSSEVIGFQAYQGQITPQASHNDQHAALFYASQVKA